MTARLLLGSLVLHVQMKGQADGQVCLLCAGVAARGWAAAGSSPAGTGVGPRRAQGQSTAVTQADLAALGALGPPGLPQHPQDITRPRHAL